MRVTEPRRRTMRVACDLVVFDLDGTIFDTHAAMERAFYAAFAKAQPRAEVIPFEELHQRQGRPFVDICGEMGWPASLPELFKQESRKRIARVQVFSEALRLVRFFAGRGTPLAVLTGKDRARSEELLGHFDLSGYFQRMVCGDDPFAGKPSPEGLSYLVDVTGSRAAATYYIGDAPADRHCALGAGVNFLGVEWPEQPKLLRYVRGCRISSSSSDLIDWFEEEPPSLRSS